MGLPEGPNSITFVAFPHVLNLTYCGEDSVCGSSHCLLGPYWTKRLGLGRGSVLSARQVSERGGEIDVVWDEDKGICKLRGKAIKVAKGTLLLA
jgi:predicted PhzF superfamily epimerase YddE/YHI9